jgi:uncharacterized protein YkwD
MAIAFIRKVANEAQTRRTGKRHQARRVFLLLLAWLVPITEDSLVHAQRESTDLTALERQVHELVNSHRTAMGLAPLAYSEEIAASARQHSRDMALGYVGLGHEGVDTRRISLSKTLSFSQFGENVGTNNYDYSAAPETAVEEWLKSSGHRKNIEGKFNLTGVGIARAGSTFFFTQIFVLTDRAARPSAQVDRADAPSPPHEQSSADPRRRTGRKRVPGGWVQDIDPTH